MLNWTTDICTISNIPHVVIGFPSRGEMPCNVQEPVKKTACIIVYIKERISVCIGVCRAKRRTIVSYQETEVCKLRRRAFSFGNNRYPINEVR